MEMMRGRNKTRPSNLSKEYDNITSSTSSPKMNHRVNVTGHLKTDHNRHYPIITESDGSPISGKKRIKVREL